MKPLFLLLLVMSFNVYADNTNYWMDKGVDFAVGAGASYVGNKLANKDNSDDSKKQLQTETQEQVIRVDGLSLICKPNNNYHSQSGCFDHETSSHLQPAVFLRKHGGPNARFVRMFYMKDYAIIQYVLVNEVKK